MQVLAHSRELDHEAVDACTFCKGTQGVKSTENPVTQQTLTKLITPSSLSAPFDNVHSPP